MPKMYKNDRNEKNTKERDRTANYTPRDEELIVTLVNKYKHVIENKTTNAATNHQKDKMWRTIANEFNSMSDTFRTPDKLKTKYHNIKKKVRKDYADAKSYKRGTGGGPVSNVDFTSTQETVISMLGTQVTGLSPTFDDDRDMAVDVSEEEISDKTGPDILQGVQESDLEANNVENSPDPTNKENNHPEDAELFDITMLNKQKSAPLRVKRLTKKSVDGQDDVTSGLINWTKTKFELAEMQKKAFWDWEEHLLKMEHQKEIHNLRIAFMTEEWEIKKQMMLLEPLQTIVAPGTNE